MPSLPRRHLLIYPCLNPSSVTGSVEGPFGANVDGAGAGGACPMDEVRRRIDRSGRADDEHQGCAIDLAPDAIHLEGNLSEEDDVRAEARAAGAARHLVQGAVDGVVFDGRTAAFLLTAGLGQFAVHMDQALRSGAFVEIVDVLGAEEEAVAEA